MYGGDIRFDVQVRLAEVTYRSDVQVIREDVWVDIQGQRTEVMYGLTYRMIYRAGVRGDIQVDVQG